MTTETIGEQREFQAEVRQILDLVIHSLYSNREIFLRELISNASDACDKLRFEALGNDALFEGSGDLTIRISVDRDARTVTVSDNGIGMSHDEVVANIGTIARSGTREFLRSLTGEQADDSRLIGQFGVGFYSAFIVADRVTLTTRRAGLPSDAGVRWESEGKGAYTIAAVERTARGTEVVLHLREDAGEFLDPQRLRSIIHKFSDHIAFPVRMPGVDGDETVNKASAMWMRPRSEITDEEYREFYGHIAHDFEPPLAWTHNRVEGTRNEYTSLLYIPARAPFDLWDREHRHGVRLYVRRVFVLEDEERLLPRWLRFVRGVIDSDDLPLNVSRELLQQNRTIDTIRTASVKRVLSLLEEIAEQKPAKYAEFWKEFGRVLKEGPVEDADNARRIAGLLRFASTQADTPEQSVSLKDYVARMKEGQEAIWYLTGEDFKAVKSSPQLEVFREKGVEVLLLTDRIDEWLVSHLDDFDGKPLRSVARGSIDADKLAAGGPEAPRHEVGAHSELLRRAKKALDDRVKDVRVGERLRQSAACLVADEHAMSPHLERMLRQAGQDVPKSLPILELNTEHPLVRALASETDDARFAELAAILLDQAVLAEGGRLDDPAAFVQRLNDLLIRLTLRG